MLPIYNTFIGGASIQQATKKCAKHIWRPIYDYVKESSMSEKYVETTVKNIISDLEVVGTSNRPSMYALKTSSFLAHPKSLVLMSKIITHAEINNVQVLIDAEDSTYNMMENKYVSTLAKVHNVSRTQVFKTYQMYRKDSLDALMNDLTEPHMKGFKLVRGAYLQKDKDKGILHSSKRDVDEAYDKGVETILDAITKNHDIELIIATHNDKSIEKAIKYMLNDDMQPYFDRVHFAQLLGMSDGLTHRIVKSGFNAYKYVPYGSVKEALPYLSRRLYENIGMIKYMI
jgi:proline dehydrogenase